HCQGTRSDRLKHDRSSIFNPLLIEHLRRLKSSLGGDGDKGGRIKSLCTWNRSTDRERIESWEDTSGLVTQVRWIRRRPRDRSRRYRTTSELGTVSHPV